MKLTRYFYSEAERPDRELECQLERAVALVEAVVSVELQPFQFDALVCLVSDVSSGLVSSPAASFQHSFLLKAINKGMFHVAAGEFHVFCYSNGHVSRRAWDKRKAEQYLFTRGELLF